MLPPLLPFWRVLEQVSIATGSETSYYIYKFIIIGNNTITYNCLNLFLPEFFQLIDAQDDHDNQVPRTCV